MDPLVPRALQVMTRGCWGSRGKQQSYQSHPPSPWLVPNMTVFSKTSKKNLVFQYVNMNFHITETWGFSVGSGSKESAWMQETWVWSLGGEYHLEKEMASHSSILAWRIPWTEEPGRLQSMGSQRVRNDWMTNTHTKSKVTSCYLCYILFRYKSQFPPIFKGEDFIKLNH